MDPKEFNFNICNGVFMLLSYDISFLYHCLSLNYNLCIIFALFYTSIQSKCVTEVNRNN